MAQNIIRNSDQAEYFGDATVFVSYGWHGTVLVEQIAALEADDRDGTNIYWLDVLAVAQNQTTPEQKRNNVADVSSFGAVVKNTHRTTLYWTNLQQPVPLGRVWW